MDYQVCTTCITAASYSLDIIDFPVVFLDEASMSTEPASLIPLMKGVREFLLWSCSLANVFGFLVKACSSYR